MIRQSMGGGNPEKRRERDVAGGTPTGFRKENPVPEEMPEDIDPAEFFDPEDFGIRRRDAGKP